MKAGTFREDLFFRLRVVELNLPPLRERRADIPLLAQTFLKEFAAENGKPVKDFATDALEALMLHRWPGNVRELRTAMEHAVIFCRGTTIAVRDLPANVRNPAPATNAREVIAGGDLTLQEAGKELLIHALKECHGSRTQAAQKLGISRRTLHRKLHEYHLEGF